MKPVKYEEVIGNYLRDYHTGSAKAIPSSELEWLFRLEGRSLRRVISALRKNGEPICSDRNGYYFAGTREELNRMIRHFGTVISDFSTLKNKMQDTSLCWDDP